MTLADLINALKKRWYILVIIPLAFALVTTIFTYTFMTNDYTSSCQCYFLKQSVVHDNKTDTDKLTTDWSGSNTIAQELTKLANSPRATSAVSGELGINNLGAYNIKVSSDQTRIVNISATGKNPNTTAQVCNAMAKQLQTLAVEMFEFDSVNIIQEATPASSPSGPDRNGIILSSVAVGFFLGLLIIFLSFILDTTIKSTDDLKEQVDLPVLAQIPYIKKL